MQSLGFHSSVTAQNTCAQESGFLTNSLLILTCTDKLIKTKGKKNQIKIYRHMNNNNIIDIYNTTYKN